MKQYTTRDFQRILRNNGYELVRQRGSHAVYSGLVNICIVEKITKFDNDIFLDFRAAGKSFAGSTIRLRMACP